MVLSGHKAWQCPTWQCPDEGSIAEGAAAKDYCRQRCLAIQPPATLRLKNGHFVRQCLAMNQKFNRENEDALVHTKKFGARV